MPDRAGQTWPAQGCPNLEGQPPLPFFSSSSLCLLLLLDFTAATPSQRSLRRKCRESTLPPDCTSVLRAISGAAVAVVFQSPSAVAVGCSQSKLAAVSRCSGAVRVAIAGLEPIDLAAARTAPATASAAAQCRRGSSNPHSSGIRALKRLKLSGALVDQRPDLSAIDYPYLPF
ncbi:hypothetical protein M9H77_21136 [Catharanthus roseus]|uniref:Uncharacterized protein n=1 Tax=Catharanthus roseus TaxID=4058 RepID=A0ACC0ALH3_CATRO|nr:hypothetical protein M9H77_21136 [Catharanthus roseus]